jgi:D-alanyl-D-alanine carboxypeptidase
MGTFTTRFARWCSLRLELTFIAMSVQELDSTAWGNDRHYHPGWVYHGLAVGPPSEAALVLDCLLYSSLLSEELKAEMHNTVSVGGPFPNRPAVAPGYGLGLMIDPRSPLGQMVGHTGQGPGSTSAVYSFPDRRPRTTLAAFVPRDDANAMGALETYVIMLGKDAPAR